MYYCPEMLFEIESIIESTQYTCFRATNTFKDSRNLELDTSIHILFYHMIESKQLDGKHVATFAGATFIVFRQQNALLNRGLLNLLLPRNLEDFYQELLGGKSFSKVNIFLLYS